MSGIDWGDLPPECPIRIYFVPYEKDGAQACYVFEHVGGPKRYMRLFIPPGEWFPNHDGPVEWGWTLHPTAILLFEAEGLPHER